MSGDLDQALAHELKDRLELLELAIRRDPHPSLVAEYTALRALYERAWENIHPGTDPQPRIVAGGESIEDLVHLLGEMWLYIQWRKVTRNLTTEQKELLADCVVEWSGSMHPDEPANPERWWRD